MDFTSAYAHGFARVAACTIPVAIADPAANVRSVLDQARACHEDGVVVAVFPELCLSGYAIDDLLLQDTLLEAVQDAIAEVVAASADLLPILVVGAPVVHGTRVLNGAVVVHRGRVLGVAPKSYLPTYREFYERRHFAPGDDRRDAWVTVAGQEVPCGPDLLFRAVDVPGLALHVEVCEDMWVPIPPSAEAALAGATVLANLSGSPITVGRAEERHLLARSASARCSAAYLYAAAGQGESTTDLSWDGQTMIYENGELLAESERFPEHAAASVADVDLDRLRQERLRAGTFDDNRRTHDERVRRFRTVEVELAPPTGDLGLRRKVDRFPFVPDELERLALDCYEAYNIQVSGIEQRLTAIGHPKIVIGVSGGLDSTHALIVAAKAMDRLGRPRSDILAFTMPGFATGDDHQVAGHPALDEPRGDLRRDRHPAGRRADARRPRPPLLRGRGGLRRHLRERPGGAALRLPVPVGQPSWRHRARHRRPLRAGAGLVHLRHRRPDVALQRQRRRTEDVGPAPDPVGRRQRPVRRRDQPPARRDPRAGDHPGADPDPGGPPAAAHRGHRRAVRPAGLHAVLHAAPRVPAQQDRVPRLACLAGRRRSGSGRPGSRSRTEPPTTSPTIRRWLDVFIRRFFASQFKRSALPNGPKVSDGGTMSPRGDWRMPSDAAPAAWLAELEANVPQG